MSTPITLINAFNVPVEESELFLERWLISAHAMRDSAGFRGLRMHRALHEGAELRFVNVAEWDSEQALQEASARPDFAASMRGMREDPALHITAHPAVYGVVFELPASDPMEANGTSGG